MAEPRPPRLALARLPTPLEPSPRMGPRLGISLFWKRDDLTGIGLSGNKVRKLELLLADAEASGSDTVITSGGEQSNHCRATALAAAQRGLGCVLLLRVPDPAAPPPPTANSLLDRLSGAQIRYVSAADYQRRDEHFAAIADDLRRAGKRPYVIPEGGSNALGAWGYVAAIEELRGQLQALAPARAAGPVIIVYASGSGGTGAGIELGLRLSGWTNARAIGFAVCDDRGFFQRTIAAIIDEANRRWGLSIAVAQQEDDIDIDDRAAKTTPELLAKIFATITEVATTEGVVLDPVYTGKAFFGMADWLRSEAGVEARTATVVFVHTGGIFGLFPFSAELGQSVSSRR